jgi:hypothetical protein
MSLSVGNVFFSVFLGLPLPLLGGGSSSVLSLSAFSSPNFCSSGDSKLFSVKSFSSLK